MSASSVFIPVVNAPEHLIETTSITYPATTQTSPPDSLTELLTSAQRQHALRLNPPPPPQLASATSRARQAHD